VLLLLLLLPCHGARDLALLGNRTTLIALTAETHAPWNNNLTLDDNSLRFAILSLSNYPVP